MDERTPPGVASVDDLGILADYGSRRGLAPHAEATDLVSIGLSPEGREVHLARRTAEAWARMKEASAADGIILAAYSGFRSIERQSEIIRRKLAAGETIESVLLLVAAPGYSEHHTGRAVDIGIPGAPPLTEDFAATPAFGWLQAHAGAFGFRMSYPRGNPFGIAYEPWHWCHVA
jgi:D-alanyl-D-alanine carboxypeptidase